MNRFGRKLSISASRFGRKFSDVGQKLGRKVHTVGSYVENVGESVKDQPGMGDAAHMIIKAGQGMKQVGGNGANALESFDRKKITEGLAHLGFQTQHFV